MSTPIFIITRDRVAPLKRLLEHLRPYWDDVVLVDNASSYEPMVDFLTETDLSVKLIGHNSGHLAPWAHGLVPTNTEYVVTDPDVIPVEFCPPDFMMQLHESLAMAGNAIKVGLGLVTDDLPDHYKFKTEVQRWESQFWRRSFIYGPKNVKMYRAPLDTTFALYRPGINPNTFPAYRLGMPYLMHHLPWYTDSENPTEEEIYYKEHASPGSASWVYDDILDPALKVILSD